MTDRTRWRRSSIHWRRCAPEEGSGAAVLVHGRLARLNEAAAIAWEGIEEPGGPAAILRRLRRRYPDAGQARLANDLERLLGEWRERGWIEIQRDPVFPFESLERGPSGR